MEQLLEWAEKVTEDTVTETSSSGPDDSSLYPNWSADPKELLKRLLDDSEMIDQINQTDPKLVAILRMSHCPFVLQDILQELHRKREQNTNHTPGDEHTVADCADVEGIEVAIGQDLLYAEMKVNGVLLKAIVDGCAPLTLISKGCARRCGLLDHLEEEDHFAQNDSAISQLKICGQIGSAQLTIEDKIYRCSLLVLDSEKDIFIFGFDMMQKHECIVDFRRNVLEFGYGETSVGLLYEEKEEGETSQMCQIFISETDLQAEGCEMAGLSLSSKEDDAGGA